MIFNLFFDIIKKNQWTDIMLFKPPFARRLLSTSLIIALIVIFSFYFSRESDMQEKYNKEFNAATQQQLTIFSERFGSPLFATRMQGGNFSNIANRRDFTLCAQVNRKLACSKDAELDYIWEGFVARKDGAGVDISVPRQVRFELTPFEAAQVLNNAVYAFSNELLSK